MLTVTCPSCQEKGRIPAKFVGIRIKCKMCGTGFLVTPPPAKAGASKTAASSAPAMQAEPQRFEGIEVEGFDQSLWSAAAEPVSDAKGEPEHHDEESSSFTATGSEPAMGVKEYKLLTQKDKFFAGKFDLGRLEEALNFYAKQGWVVKSMATPHLTGFSGGPREEFIVLLER